jgi:hypothetical protein
LKNEDRLKIQSWADSSEQHLGKYHFKPQLHFNLVQSVLTFPAKSFGVDMLMVFVGYENIVGKIIQLVTIAVMNNLAFAKLSSELLFCCPAMYEDVASLEPEEPFFVNIELHIHRWFFSTFRKASAIA